MGATGMVTSTVGRGVKDASGTEVGAIMLMQYNPKLTALLDKQSVSKILRGAVAGAQGMIPGKETVTSHVLSGIPVRLLRGKEVSIAIVYTRGGHLMQVIGPEPDPVLTFTGAYLAATR